MKLKTALKRILKNPVVKKIGIISGLVVISLGVLVFSYNLAYKDKIFPKTYIGNVNLGGKTETAAMEILSSQIQSAKDSKINIIVSGKTHETSPADLNVTYDAKASADLAWQVGRQGSLKKIVLEQLKSIFTSNRNLAVFSLNNQRLRDLVTNLQSEVNVPEHDATITITDMIPQITEESNGKNLSFPKASKGIINAVGNFKQELSLEVEITTPKIIRENAQAALQKTKMILESPGLVLKSDRGTFNLTPKDFVSWLTFVGILGKQEVQDDQNGNLKVTDRKTTDVWVLDVQVDQGKIGEYINNIASQINQDPKDARFAIKNGKAVAFQLSQTGYQLDREKAIGLLSGAIISGKESSLDLPVKIVKPEITDNSAESMGIKELVGEGDTSWRGSPSNRIHNLSLGAEKISGTIVKPGQEFSTVKTIGEIGPSTGFLPELVIKNSTQVVPEYGGGLCQVSTTLFRAVLNTGLKITDRTPHSFRVSYYEPPVGMDATIYDPRPDFKFINTMDTPILIWGIAGNNGLTFQIYGTKDDRKVDISDPWVGDYTSPSEAVYTESDSMAPGEIRQVERATSGCSASFTYKVTASNGEVLENETFTSKYVALPNSYLYGPGTEIPAPPAE